jgi:hydroxymethylpyrimidine pyrophosphatase-like HAD family hydrolase
VLASDFDGTLAVHGWVPVETLAAVARFRAAGGLLVLVTGRRVPELAAVFPELADVVDLVVAENGGVLLDPASPPGRALAAPLPDDLEALLAEHGVGPAELGEVLVSAAREDEQALERVAAALAGSWPCQVVPNKDRVMLVPAGVDKGTGLRAALLHLDRDLADVLAIGDGENDLHLLRGAGLAVAVADAVPALIAEADVTTNAASSAGVVEAIERLLRS